MKNIDKLKLYLKETATKIRQLKAAIPELQRAGKAYWREQGSLASAKYEYRHHHIAYCELRGRTRDEIESPRDGNEPNESHINRIKEQYAWTPEEIEAYTERQRKNSENVHTHS